MGRRRDCIAFFDSSLKPDLPRFLYGESLGGAIAVLIAAEQRLKWRGVVLNGALCGVSGNTKPWWPLELLLPVVAAVAPRWRAWVTGNTNDASHRVGWKRDLARGSPVAQRSEYVTAATAREMVRICGEVERKGREVEAAMLVVHDGDDRVCDVEAAERLFRAAASRESPGVGEAGEGRRGEREMSDGNERRSPAASDGNCVTDCVTDISCSTVAESENS